MSFPDKEQRRSCWDARDKYWRCLNDKAPKHSPTSGADEPEVCLQFRRLFETKCPAQWVKHFDRKMNFEQFKKKLDRGYDPVNVKEKQ